MNSRRLLLAALAVATLAGGTIVAAQRGDTTDVRGATSTPTVPALPPSGITGIPVDSQREVPEVSPAEAVRARSTLEEDEVFKSIAAQTTWVIAEAVPNMSDDGEKIGVALIVQLDEMTEASGPWRQFRCQGSVIHEYSLTYRNIMLLGAVFNADGSELVALAPLAAASNMPLESDSSVEVPQPECPPGKEEGGY